MFLVLFIYHITFNGFLSYQSLIEQTQVFVDKEIETLNDDLNRHEEHLEKLKQNYTLVEKHIQRFKEDNLRLKSTINNIKDSASPSPLPLPSSPQGGNPLEDDQKQAIERKEEQEKIAILIFTFDRTEYLSKTLDRLYEQIEKGSLEDRFDIIVSQDGYTTQVTQFLNEQQIQRPDIHHLIHDRSNNFYPPKTKKTFLAYFAIAQHYEWALRQVFSMPQQYRRVLVLEDDLQLAPDALEYFAAMSWLLDADPTLLCISGWNDQGMSEYVADPSVFHRTDLFPGLGWMMSRKLWDEIKDRWPQGFWDDWLREPEQRQQRACIRPEVPRTATFGKKGASGGQFYRKYLSRIYSNDIAPINFDRLDTSQLIKEHYDPWLQETINAAHPITLTNLKKLSHANPLVAVQSNGYKLHYNNLRDLSRISKQLKLMDDPKSGVPRAAYMGGVIPIKYKGHPLYIVPKESVYNY